MRELLRLYLAVVGLAAILVGLAALWSWAPSERLPDGAVTLGFGTILFTVVAGFGVFTLAVVGLPRPRN
jgi:hypothetical protein